MSTEVNPRILIVGGSDSGVTRVRAALCDIGVECVQVITPEQAVESIEAEFPSYDIKELMAKPLFILPDAEYCGERQVPTMRQRIRGGK